jgi:hypothetical protein
MIYTCKLSSLIQWGLNYDRKNAPAFTKEGKCSSGLYDKLFTIVIYDCNNGDL